MTPGPKTVETLALIERGRHSRIVVTLDEAATGARFVSIKRCRLLTGEGEAQKAWREIRGVALQLEDLPAVASAIASAMRRSSP